MSASLAVPAGSLTLGGYIDQMVSEYNSQVLLYRNMDKALDLLTEIDNALHEKIKSMRRGREQGVYVTMLFKVRDLKSKAKRGDLF